MTYTFKLARRLAILRHFAVLTVLMFLVACEKDFTAPETTSSASFDDPSTLRVLPRAVTIETSQRVQFRGRAGGQTDGRRDISFHSPLSWAASGGTISAEGTFSSSMPGTFKVIGRGRGWKQTDTSIVTVVPPPSDLARIEVTPASFTLDTGATKTFAATGYLSDGSTATVGVEWSATGGEIDPSGVYTAGPSGGTFRIIATTTTGALADTASVVINAPSPPPPPALASVFVSPASVTLATGGSKQFTAYGRNTAGDSVPVTVAFKATGGTITTGGLYTAGSTGGTYKIIASVSGLADTSIATIAAVSTGSTGRVGVPFGPSQQLTRAGEVVSPFTLTKDMYTPSTIVSRIQAARAGGYHLLLSLADGSHRGTEDGTGPLLSIINGVLQFDEAKWRAQVDRYNTPEIKSAVEAAVRDGVIIGNHIMDEPYVHDPAGNTWGPVGTMTKARVDGMCQYVKNLFPTLPVGPEHQHHLFEPTKSYRVCDFFIDQYKAAYGSATTYRDAALAIAQRDGHSILFGLNVLDGGVPDKDGTWDCTSAGQAGKGTYSPQCRMTPTQVRDWGLLLGPAGCGLYMWRYDSAFITNSGNQQAFADLGAGLAKAAWKSCARP